MLAICFSAMFMTSCEEIEKSTYYVSIEEMSTNCTANLFIQAEVLAVLQNSGEDVYYFGEESDAISWFDNICKEFADPSFVEDIPVSDETWMDLKLVEAFDGVTVKVTRVTFAE